MTKSEHALEFGLMTFIRRGRYPTKKEMEKRGIKFSAYLRIRKKIEEYASKDWVKRKIKNRKKYRCMRCKSYLPFHRWQFCNDGCKRLYIKDG